MRSFPASDKTFSDVPNDPKTGTPKSHSRDNRKPRGAFFPRKALGNFAGTWIAIGRRSVPANPSAGSVCRCVRCAGDKFVRCQLRCQPRIMKMPVKLRRVVLALALIYSLGTTPAGAQTETKQMTVDQLVAKISKLREVRKRSTPCSRLSLPASFWSTKASWSSLIRRQRSGQTKCEKNFPSRE